MTPSPDLLGERIKVLHTVDGLAAASGGPSRTITALCDHLAREPDLSIILCAQRLPHEKIVMPAQDSLVELRLALSRNRLVGRCGRPLLRLIGETFQAGQPALLHDHGLWTLSHHGVAALCRRYSIPLVLHPRGMLEKMAMERHFLRKKIAWFSYVKKDLRTVSLFIATSEPEIESIRRCGFRQPVAHVPNGVLLPDAAAVTSLQALSPPSPARTALFVGRIHPIKGLLNLIDAWNAARPQGWRLILAGPDEDGHRRQVEERIRAHGLSAVVSFAGEVRGAEKAGLFASADLFILPSFSENFGVAVAEALSYGIPVITTTGTPWREVARLDCGWWMAPRPDALADALRQATAMPAPQLRAMGERGRELARRYDWRVIAHRTAAVYRWLLRRDVRPAWVTVD